MEILYGPCHRDCVLRGRAFNVQICGTTSSSSHHIIGTNSFNSVYDALLGTVLVPDSRAHQGKWLVAISDSVFPLQQLMSLSINSTRISFKSSISCSFLFVAIQVVRDEGVAIGRLVRKVEQEPDADVAHWIVSFEGDTEEHEVTEKYIGRLVDNSETESIKSRDSPLPTTKSSSSSIGSASLGKSPNGNAAKKGKSPPRKSASPHRGGAKPSTRSNNKDGKSLLKGIKTTKKAPRGQKQLGENESVVKVKMLTGTLYLFRGENPRAEFVRTV